jgi:hypothetical protein
LDVYYGGTCFWSQGYWFTNETSSPCIIVEKKLWTPINKAKGKTVFTKNSVHWSGMSQNIIASRSGISIPELQWKKHLTLSSHHITKNFCSQDVMVF